MRKLIFFFTFFMSLLFFAHAGYVLRGINATDIGFDNLINYTLTLKNDAPVAAASMHTSSGGGMGRNSVVIIPADTSVSATYFPFIIGIEDFDIEVRDFHYYADKDLYVLCGSRQTEFDSIAFVAVIEGDFSQIRYAEYNQADIFYSLSVPNRFRSDYYVCGNSGNLGAIASIDTNTLDLTNLFYTDNDWECHKIIEKPVNSEDALLVISGRNPYCTAIGYTVIDPQFRSGTTYMWGQLSATSSLSVVCDNVFDNDFIILASSYQSSVTLNLIFSLGNPQIGVSNYSFATPNGPYYVQDIDMLDTLISVAGFVISYRNQAWYGSVSILNLGAPMVNKFYPEIGGGYTHYKIRYGNNGETYTGGHFRDDNSNCALFGTPRVSAENCESIHSSSEPIGIPVMWLAYTVLQQDPNPTFVIDSDSLTPSMSQYVKCEPFRGGKTAPEFAMPSPENE